MDNDQYAKDYFPNHAITREFLLSVIDDAPSGIAVLEARRDADSIITGFRWILANRIFERLSGNDHLAGSYYCTRHPLSTEGNTFYKLVKVVEDGTIEEFNVHSANGENEHPIRLIASKLGDGVILKSQNIPPDNTTDEEVQSQAHFIRAVTDTAPGIIAITDHPSGEVRFNNQDTLRFLGFDPEEIVAIGHEGRMKLLHPDDVNGLQEYYTRFDNLKNDEENRLEYRIRNKHGDYVWLDVRGRIFRRDQDGKAIQTLHIAQDITGRKKAEEEIFHLKDEITRKATDKYLQLFNAMDQGVQVCELIFDDEGKAVDVIILEVNAAWEKITGIKPEVVIRRNISEWLPSLEYCWLCSIEKVIRTGVSEKHEHFVTDLRRWFEVYLSRIEGNRFMALFTDTTERRRVEEALRKSEERFRRYFELGLIGMAITSPAKGLVEVNDEICKILGYGREELLNMTWAELTHPQDVSADVRNFDRVISGEMDGYSMDKRLVRKDGQIMYATISVKALRNNEGKVDYFVALLQDITHRKKAEEAIKGSEERFRTLSNLVPDLLWSNDSRGMMRWFNEQWSNYTGQTMKQALNYGWLRAVHPDDVERTHNKFIAAIEQGKSLRLEERIRSKEGEYRWFLLQANPVVNAEGQIVQWYGAATDIHERKLLEVSTAAQNVLLEELVAQRTSALEESNKLMEEEHHFLEQITDKSPHLIYVFDIAERRFTYINKRTEELIGKSEDYVYAMGSHLFQAVIHPEDVSKHIAYMYALASLEEHEIRSIDFRVWNGTVFRWFRSKDSIFLTEDGKVKQVIGLAEDITYEKLLEEKIRSEETQLRLN